MSSFFQWYGRRCWTIAVEFVVVIGVVVTGLLFLVSMTKLTILDDQGGCEWSNERRWRRWWQWIRRKWAVCRRVWWWQRCLWWRRSGRDDGADGHALTRHFYYFCVMVCSKSGYEWRVRRGGKNGKRKEKEEQELGPIYITLSKWQPTKQWRTLWGEGGGLEKGQFGGSRPEWDYTAPMTSIHRLLWQRYLTHLSAPSKLSTISITRGLDKPKYSGPEMALHADPLRRTLFASLITSAHAPVGVLADISLSGASAAWIVNYALTFS